MLTTKRDMERGCAHHAIPSLGEIEGRLAVLEIVAQCALTHALDEGDECADKALLHKINEAMHSKCLEMKLGRADSQSAIDFAEELIDSAIKESKLPENALKQ